MPKFSQRSLDQLDTIHPTLREILEEAIKVSDFIVLEGHRGEEAQNKAFREGRSKIQWPKGNHNKSPSTAADIAPVPIDWDSKHAGKKFAFLAGIVTGVAATKGVKIRWGGDWDGDGQMNDQSFHDLPHVELVLT
jgi:peptidoglycan LD-endopeptidase CwlK